MNVKRTKRHVVITLTPNQADALWDLVGAANRDGDHEQWMKSAAALPHEIRACRDVMNIVGAAQRAAHNDQAQRPG